MTTATYRFLDIGDPIQAGDEYFDPQTWKWMLISERRPGSAHERCTLRRLQAQPKLPTSPHFLVSQRLTEELAQARTNAEVTRLSKTAKQQEGEIKNLRERVRSLEARPARPSYDASDVTAGVVEAFRTWRAPYIADQHKPFYKDEPGYELLREGDTPCPGDEYAQQAIAMSLCGPVAASGLRWVPFNTNCSSFCCVVGREKGMTWRRPKATVPEPFIGKLDRDQLKPASPGHRILGANEIIRIDDFWLGRRQTWKALSSYETEANILKCIGSTPAKHDHGNYTFQRKI